MLSYNFYNVTHEILFPNSICYLLQSNNNACGIDFFMGFIIKKNQSMKKKF